MAGKWAVFWTDPANEAQLWAGGWPSACSLRNMTAFPSRCDTPCRLLSFTATLTITLAAGTPYLRTGAKEESLHWQPQAHWKSLALGKVGNSWCRSWMMKSTCGRPTWTPQHCRCRPRHGFASFGPWLSRLAWAVTVRSGHGPGLCSQMVPFP